MNWKTFLLGLLEAALSGGTVAFSTNMVDPHDFNVYTRKFWMCAGASALVSSTKYAMRVLNRLTKGDPDLEGIRVAVTTGSVAPATVTVAAVPPAPAPPVPPTPPAPAPPTPPAPLNPVPPS